MKKYEFLENRELPKEPFRLKEGVDPATVDWEEELKQFTLICDGIQSMQDKVNRIIVRNRSRYNEIESQTNKYEI